VTRAHLIKSITSRYQSRRKVRIPSLRYFRNMISNHKRAWVWGCALHMPHGAEELQPERARLSIEPGRPIGGRAGESACSTEDRQRRMSLQTGKSRGTRRRHGTRTDSTELRTKVMGQPDAPGCPARGRIDAASSVPECGTPGQQLLHRASWRLPAPKFGISSSNAPPRTLQEPARYGEHRVRARRPRPAPLHPKVNPPAPTPPNFRLRVPLT
jgi:hypothetical protein